MLSFVEYYNMFTLTNLEKAITLSHVHQDTSTEMICHAQSIQNNDCNRCNRSYYSNKYDSFYSNTRNARNTRGTSYNSPSRSSMPKITKNVFPRTVLENLSPDFLNIWNERSHNLFSLNALEDYIINPLYDVIKTSDDDILTPLTVDELNNDLEPYGFAYDASKDLFYSNMECWQKAFGYCRFYDEGCAPLSMIVDSEPVYFEYDGKSWLIELWKGQYGLNTGCEIGVYNVNKTSIDKGDLDRILYKAVEGDELLELEFSLYKNKKFILTRKERHWWLTAFKLGLFSHPRDLTLDCKITLKDEEMLSAFIGGLHNTGYKSSDYEINDLTVHILFHKPKSKQPYTRKSYIDFIMQLNNKTNCRAYQIITRDYDNTIDKVNYLKQTAPGLYDMLLDLGKTTALINTYQLLTEKIAEFQKTSSE